eukprot:1920611-Amphidinium_carterae.2
MLPELSSSSSPAADVAQGSQRVAVLSCAPQVLPVVGRGPLMRPPTLSAALTIQFCIQSQVKPSDSFPREPITVW